MENSFILDPLNDIHLFCLHYIFIPCINRALLEFQHQYNNHPLRTENHLTPMQLFHVPNLCGMVTFDDPTVVSPDYGIDEDGPHPYLEDSDAVIINTPQVQLTAEQWEFIGQRFNPLDEDNSFGINIYEQLLNFVTLSV